MAVRALPKHGYSAYLLNRHYRHSRGLWARGPGTWKMRPSALSAEARALSTPEGCPCSEHTASHTAPSVFSMSTCGAREQTANFSFVRFARLQPKFAVLRSNHACQQIFERHAPPFPGGRWRGCQLRSSAELSRRVEHTTLIFHKDSIMAAACDCRKPAAAASLPVT